MLLRWTALVAVILCLCASFPLYASASVLDTDNDGLTDEQETRLFLSDPQIADTDGDGFLDGQEVRAGYDPRKAKNGRLDERDADADGLSDRLELLFGTDAFAEDTDGDGFLDGQEIASGYDPRDTAPKLLAKRIRVDLSEQRLYQELGGVVLASHRISSGKASTPTPVGTYKILNKHPRAWSRSAALWMPYWMAFRKDGYGMHELPEWPGGKKEGKNHLGIPVSHGCVRLGEDAAKDVYEWTPVGTSVVIER